MNITIGGYIDYENDDMARGEEWHATANKLMKNVKSHFPKVTKVKKFYDINGIGVRIWSEDLDTLKHLWVVLGYGNGEQEYQKHVKNGTLEYELKSTGFYYKHNSEL